MSTESETNGGRRVGELATATGLTVRTLHYYEEIGLLDPPERTPAGHRLYSADDVERLYRVSVLRGLGLPLGEIKKALDDPSWQLRSALDAHLVDIDARLAHRVGNPAQGAGLRRQKYVERRLNQCRSLF